MKSWVTQLRKGAGELVVLAALQRGEAYGYELLQRINQTPGIGMTESTVYPLLARLTKDEYLTVRAAPSKTGPPRRYYKLTRAGRRRLKEMSGCWNEFTDGVESLLRGSKDE